MLLLLCLSACLYYSSKHCSRWTTRCLVTSLCAPFPFLTPGGRVCLGRRSPHGSHDHGARAGRGQAEQAEDGVADGGGAPQAHPRRVQHLSAGLVIPQAAPADRNPGSLLVVPFRVHRPSLSACSMRRSFTLVGGASEHAPGIARGTLHKGCFAHSFTTECSTTPCNVS